MYMLVVNKNFRSGKLNILFIATFLQNLIKELMMCNITIVL